MNIKELDFKPHPAEIGGSLARIYFENGYGASIVAGEMFYSRPGTPYEIAVLIGDKEENSITYDTPITSDVLGYLTVEQAEKALDDIAALPKYKDDGK